MRPHRSATFRLAAAFLAFALLSAALLSGAAYLAAGAWFGAAVRASASDEVARLAAIEARGGWRALAEAVGAAGPGAEGEPFVYRLEPRGGPASGTPLLLGEARRGGWRDAWPPWGEEDEPYVARAAAFEGGVLVVAAEAERLHDAREFFAEEVPLGLALVLPVSLPGALAVAAFSLRRIERIARTVRRVEAGALSERAPVRAWGDEYDRLAAAVNAMLDGLENLNEGLRQVSADIAHDLRSPLARLRAHLHDLRDAPADGDADGDARALREGVEAAGRQVDEVLELFGALLRIAQIEGGAGRGHFARLDLAELLLDLADTYASVAEEHGQSLTAAVGPSLHVVGDRALLAQLFVNLIENAIRHTPSGTSIAVGLRAEGGAARASVADDGPGVPEAERARVFRRFYRLPGSRYAGGAGLGLALVAAVARAHGGSVAMEDNAPGARVVVRLPLAPAPVPDRPAPRPGGPDTHGGELGGPAYRRVPGKPHMPLSPRRSATLPGRARREPWTS